MHTLIYIYIYAILTFLQLPVAAHSQRSHSIVLVNYVTLEYPRQYIIYREDWGIVCERDWKREREREREGERERGR